MIICAILRAETSKKRCAGTYGLIDGLEDVDGNFMALPLCRENLRKVSYFYINLIANISYALVTLAFLFFLVVKLHVAMAFRRSVCHFRHAQ